MESRRLGLGLGLGRRALGWIWLARAAMGLGRALLLGPRSLQSLLFLQSLSLLETGSRLPATLRSEWLRAPLLLTQAQARDRDSAVSAAALRAASHTGRQAEPEQPDNKRNQTKTPAEGRGVYSNRPNKPPFSSRRSPYETADSSLRPSSSALKRSLTSI
jgi:hypothetical protein